MTSEPVLAAALGASVAALLALAAGAGYFASAPSPRLSVLCLLAAGAPLAALVACVRRLAAGAAPRGAPVHERARVPADAGARAAAGGQAARDALDARLEHAPIALFRIARAGDAGAVTPLNASARRLLAPGRARVPAALRALLAQQAAGQRQLLSFDTERGVERALVAVSALTLDGAAERLAALMPVESELEAEALNAWRELVQVLTHEIMNSLTPVASLSRTACDLLDDARAALPQAIHADLGTALDAIARRAASLADFVASYRSLSTLPPPRPEHVSLERLFERLSALLAPAWTARGGTATFTVAPASLAVRVDPGQLEQALINLLTNAAEATAALAAPRVAVSARLSRGGRLHIEVLDNGPGVPDALAAHIFTPFFSTKKQGRGIGLALVRHLVHANGGTVRHAHSVSAGARFLLAF